MVSRLRSVKRLLIDLPRQLRLAYCLMFDPRVPRYTKLTYAGALGAIALPVIDLPEAIPVIGELDVIALSLLATRLFISACPHYAVEEQERLIMERRSRFDEDVRKGERIAMILVRRFQQRSDEVNVVGTVSHADTTQGASA